MKTLYTLLSTIGIMLYFIFSMGAFLIGMALPFTLGTSDFNIWHWVVIYPIILILAATQDKALNYIGEIWKD